MKYAKVFPLSKTVDFKVPAKWYRRAVGGVEVFSGVCLAFVPYSKYLKEQLTSLFNPNTSWLRNCFIGAVLIFFLFKEMLNKEQT